MVNTTEAVSCWHAWRRKADESAFEALIHGETRYAADLARRMGASEAEAEDAVQDALLKLARERTDTPVEVASKVDAVMAPLAVVYSRSLYGSGVAATEELVGVAKTSFVQTEQRLATRHSRFERLVASYRIGSLLPRWWRRRSSRRRPDS